MKNAFKIDITKDVPTLFKVEWFQSVNLEMSTSIENWCISACKKINEKTSWERYGKTPRRRIQRWRYSALKEPCLMYRLIYRVRSLPCSCLGAMCMGSMFMSTGLAIDHDSAYVCIFAPFARASALLKPLT